MKTSELSKFINTVLEKNNGLPREPVKICHTTKSRRTWLALTKINTHGTIMMMMMMMMMMMI